MNVVVSDTSPIRYLVLIEEIHILERLYGRILVPVAVVNELQTEKTPPLVKQWIQARPSWVEFVSPASIPALPYFPGKLGPGETEAIRLASLNKADLLLIDERAGAKFATSIGLHVTGTLGVIVESAIRGWIKLKPTLDKLRATNFRIHPELLTELLRNSAAQ